MSKLTYKQRNRLPSSEFAEPRKRKYPLDTKNRAKNALSRVSANGDSEEKAMIRKKVHAKYPGIKVSHGFSKTGGRRKGYKRHSMKHGGRKGMIR